MYFVSICTNNRECYFGSIQNSEMVLSDLGKVAQREWYKTAEIRADMNLGLGEFVVMPNHIHGIITIGDNSYNNIQDPNYQKITFPINASVNKFGTQSKNLASVLRGYKSVVTSFAKREEIVFDWQARFHDRIIRSYTESQNISNYIFNNPANWNKDELYKP